MTLGRLDSIWRYPVKGLPGQRLDGVTLTPGRPLPHDRRFAVAQGDADFGRERPGWIRRSNFLQVANNAPLVRLQPEHRPESAALGLRNGSGTFDGDLADPADGEKLVDFLSTVVGEDALRGRPRLVEIPADLPPGADGQSFADTAPPHVSLINLASVRDLGGRMGADLDPQRFRGNLLIEAEPWTEFDWLDKTIEVGGVRLEVVRRIERCAATTVNPRTAERDQQVPLALRRNFGHADCGVYAIVRSDGAIREGAEITAARG
ncbi:MAG: MOSC domain-containing protein [Alphaproteobacteria bacterium]